VNRRLTAAQHKRAERLFALAAARVEQSLGNRVKDVSTVRSLDAEERAWFAQSFNDGDCEYTLELTAVRP
jgi:predicted ATPase